MVIRNFWKHLAQKTSFSHLKLGRGQTLTSYSMPFQKEIHPEVWMVIQWSWSGDAHPQQAKSGHLRSIRLTTFKYIIVINYITMLCIRSPELPHLLTRSLYLLTNISPFPPLATGNHRSTLFL